MLTLAAIFILVIAQCTPLLPLLLVFIYRNLIREPYLLQKNKPDKGKMLLLKFKFTIMLLSSCSIITSFSSYISIFPHIRMTLTRSSSGTDSTYPRLEAVMPKAM